MLPFDQPWYRRLLGYAFVLGLTAGGLGLLYLAITGESISFVFGDPVSEPWSGKWWWIPVVAVGGVLVAYLRIAWRAPEKVPGAIDQIAAADVDHGTAPRLVVISAVSLVFGASLGPSFALVVMGGALGSWLAERKWAEGRADSTYTLVGMSGGLGGAFTSPILGAFMVSEIAPTKRADYVATIIPQMISAILGFMVFYVVVGRTFYRSFELPEYAFVLKDMALAILLGVAAVAVLVAFIVVTKLVDKLAGLVPNPYLLAGVGGGLVGLIAVAMPLTLASGNEQLAAVLGGATVLSTGLLVMVVLGKMVALSISVRIGFIGGNVFPMIFIGGASGLAVHQMFPDIPVALAVSCLMAAVPGSVLKAPVSLTLVAAISVGLGATTTAPVIVAVITAYVTVATVRYLMDRSTEAPDAEPA
jgi:H+/Cl- antiporter ClcA